MERRRRSVSDEGEFMSTKEVVEVEVRTPSVEKRQEAGPQRITSRAAAHL